MIHIGKNALLAAAAVAFALPVTAGADEKTPSKAETADSVVVIALPSVLERQASRSDIVSRGPTEECYDFLVRATGKPPQRLIVTTSGIAGAVLLQGARLDQSCSRSLVEGHPVLAIADPESKTWRLRLIVPKRAFPSLAEGAKARLVVVLAGAPPQEIELTVRRQEWSTLFTAFSWLLGTVVTVLVSGVAGLYFGGWQRRAEANAAERDKLAAFTKDKTDQLGPFFGTLYHNVLELPRHEMGDKMKTELIDKGVIDALPADQAALVLKAIASGESRKLSALLTKAFPEFEDRIVSKDGSGA